MRLTTLFLAGLMLAACRSDDKAEPPDTDGPLITDTELVEDTDAIDTEVADTDIIVDPPDPIMWGQLMSPVPAGGTRVSESYRLRVSVGDPFSRHDLETPDYKLSVGIGSIHPRAAAP